MADTTNETTESKPESAGEFESLAAEQTPGIIAEFWDFLIHNKKWWLTPIIIVLALVGAFVILSGTIVAPFIYPMF